MEIVIAILSSILGASGLWSFILTMVVRKQEKRDNSTRLLLGIGHDRIIHLCKHYIAQGSISADEYENLYEYLYKPYVAMGGNGTAQKLMEDVKRLPIKEETL